MQADEWFEYADDQSQHESQEYRSQVVGDSQAFLPTISRTDVAPALPQEQEKQLVFAQKKRHLFTVHSGSN